MDVEENKGSGKLERELDSHLIGMICRWRNSGGFPCQYWQRELIRVHLFHIVLLLCVAVGRFLFYIPNIALSNAQRLLIGYATGQHCASSGYPRRTARLPQLHNTAATAEHWRFFMACQCCAKWTQRHFQSTLTVTDPYIATAFYFAKSKECLRKLVSITRSCFHMTNKLEKSDVIIIRVIVAFFINAVYQRLIK